METVYSWLSRIGSTNVLDDSYNEGKIMAAVKFEHSSITYNGFDKIETGSIFFFTNGVDSLLNEFPYFSHISE